MSCRHAGTRPPNWQAWVEATLVCLSMGCGGPALGARPIAAGLDDELLEDLVGWAARLSGRPLPPPEQARPVIVQLDADDLARRVCGERADACRGLVGVYGTHDRTIVLRADLDLRDPTDQSFLVHELVHWLQHLAEGDDIDAGCRRVMAHEAEAYQVQNHYLARWRQWRRVGEMLRFMHCPEDSAGEPQLEFGGARDPHPVAAPVGHPRSLGDPVQLTR